MKKLLGLAITMTLLAVPAAMAENNGAGCGLGKTLFEGQRGLVPNILAMTTNGISGNNTFGMTSGTSGCEQDSVVKTEHEQKVFVAANLDSLSEDAARGDGEYLHALSGLMGCGQGAYGQFASLTQEQYDVIFGGADAPQAVLTSLKAELGSDPVLSSRCSRVS